MRRVQKSGEGRGRAVWHDCNKSDTSGTGTKGTDEGRDQAMYSGTGTVFLRFSHPSRTRFEKPNGVRVNSAHTHRPKQGDVANRENWKQWLGSIPVVPSTLQPLHRPFFSLTKGKDTIHSTKRTKIYMYWTYEHIRKSGSTPLLTQLSQTQNTYSSLGWGIYFYFRILLQQNKNKGETEKRRGEQQVGKIIAGKSLCGGWVALYYHPVAPSDLCSPCRYSVDVRFK